MLEGIELDEGSKDDQPQPEEEDEAEDSDAPLHFNLSDPDQIR